MNPTRSSWLRRIGRGSKWAAVAAASATLGVSPAKAKIEVPAQNEQPSFKARVAAVRARLAEAELSQQASARSPAARVVAQWDNWPNWNNVGKDNKDKPK
jgi:hypothetical protein